MLQSAAAFANDDGQGEVLNGEEKRIVVQIVNRRMALRPLIVIVDYV